MLRSLLVALDGSDSSISAGRFAIGLAKRVHADIEALGIVNSAWINRPEPLPVGGAALRAESNARRLDEAGKRVRSGLTTFRGQAEQAGITSLKARAVEGDPLAILQDEGTAHDVFILGRNSLFDAEADIHRLPIVVERIVRQSPRPILLVPDSETGEDQPFGPVLVAYDGSAASSRSLHLFALLGMANDQPIHVLSLDNDSEENANRLAQQGCMLLRKHGAQHCTPIGLGNHQAGTASETILGTARTVGARLIVMGAYGHSGIREIFGSCTRDVLKACPISLFLHH